VKASQILIAQDGRLRAIWRFLLSVVIFGFSRMVAIMAASLAPGSQAAQLTFFYTAHTLALLGGFALLLYLLDRVRSSPLEAMGLGLKSWAIRDSIIGAIFGAGMVALAVAVIGAWGDVSFSAQLRPGDTGRLALLLWVLAMAAMVEELVFRGYPFQRLLESVGALGAIVILSALFGLAHWNNPNANIWGVLNTILVGVMFALAYLRTRSLWLPWGMHFGWNAMLGLALGLPVSGSTAFAVAVRGTANGPEWLTGGTYGIEAGASGTLAILVGMLLLVKFVRPRPAAAVQLAQDAPPISIEEEPTEASPPASK
jgi:hypothetical protein